MSLPPDQTLGSDRVSQLVVEAIAEAEGVHPADVPEPLHTAVDPESLDRLFDVSSHDPTNFVRVEFTYLGYLVRVSCLYGIQVEPLGVQEDLVE
jgi:site-specific recombinase XerC